MTDAWVWDMYRPARFVKHVQVLTFKDVNVEELNLSDLDPPAPDRAVRRPQRPRRTRSSTAARRPAPDRRAGDGGVMEPRRRPRPR